MQADQSTVRRLVIAMVMATDVSELHQCSHSLPRHPAYLLSLIALNS
jgi:hypothetical protein